MCQYLCSLLHIIYGLYCIFALCLIEMIPLLQSKPQYQYEMSHDSSYPFNGLKPNHFNVNVRITIPFQLFSNENRQIIGNIIKIQNQHIIKPMKIVQSHLHKNYTIVYEYVPYKYDNTNDKIQQYIQNKLYKNQLLVLFKDMLTNGVKPQIDLINFGYNAQYVMKMFIRPHYAQSYQITSPQQIQAEANSLVEQCQKLFQQQQQPQDTWRIKVASLSQKLKKIQKQILCKQFRKKQLKMSQSGMNSSDNSDSLAKTGSNQKIGNGQWHFDPDFHFQDSFSVKQSKNKKKKRSSSFKVDEKPKNQFKQKKASWQASWKQQKSSANQSDKMTVLKKRISQALLKTQKTLSKYEKIRTKSKKKYNYA